MVDEAPLRRSLPAELEVEIGRRTVAITHDAGAALAVRPSGDAPRPSMGVLNCGRTGLIFEHVWL